MILIYRLVFIAAMYLAMLWLIVRYVFTPFYVRVLHGYHRFELRLEEADTRPFFRWADLVSKVALVTVASALAGLLLAGALTGALHLAR